jgi:hypothetical protein
LSERRRRDPVQQAAPAVDRQITCPVTNRAASEARNCTVSASSSGPAMRPIGVPASIRSRQRRVSRSAPCRLALITAADRDRVDPDAPRRQLQRQLRVICSTAAEAME